MAVARVNLIACPRPVYDHSTPYLISTVSDGLEPCPYPVVLERPVPNIGARRPVPRCRTSCASARHWGSATQTPRAARSTRPGVGNVLSSAWVSRCRRMQPPRPPRWPSAESCPAVESPTRPTFVVENADEEGRDSLRSLRDFAQPLPRVNRLGRRRPRRERRKRHK